MRTIKLHVSIEKNYAGGMVTQLVRDTLMEAMSKIGAEVVVDFQEIIATSPSTGNDQTTAAMRLSAVADFASQLRQARVVGAVGLASDMIASRLLEITRGEDI